MSDLTIMEMLGAALTQMKAAGREPRWVEMSMDVCEAGVSEAKEHFGYKEGYLTSVYGVPLVVVVGCEAHMRVQGFEIPDQNA